MLLTAIFSHEHIVADNSDEVKNNKSWLLVMMKTENAIENSQNILYISKSLLNPEINRIDFF